MEEVFEVLEVVDLVVVEIVEVVVVGFPDSFLWPILSLFLSMKFIFGFGSIL